MLFLMHLIFLLLFVLDYFTCIEPSSFSGLGEQIFGHPLCCLFLPPLEVREVPFILEQSIC